MPRGYMIRGLRLGPVVVDARSWMGASATGQTPNREAEINGSDGPTETSFSRRDLLKRTGGLAAVSLMPGVAGACAEATQLVEESDGFPRRSDFTIPEGVTYINGAYMHPMPNAVRVAVRDYNDRRAGFTTRTSDDPDISTAVKREFAELIHAELDEIAFVPNTSAGEVLVVQGLGIPGSGGNVVTDALHFEGCLAHLKWLEREAGLDLRIAMPREEGRIALEDLAALVDDRTRLIEISLVTMYNGFQHDLEAVCELAHSHGAYVYADIIQAAGAVPIDVRRTGVDFASCAGFKWLMGDLGLGFLYARRELLDRVLARTRVGYHSVSRWETHFLPHDPPGTAPFTWDLANSASAQFEVGSVAGSARAALGASIPYIRSLGVEEIQAHRQPLLARLREGMSGLGYPCITPPGSPSPIITFTTPDGSEAQRRLEAARVDVRVARNYIRFSPSVYNDMADVERALNALS